jgi:uncharacterized DUF497 family protein
MAIRFEWDPRKAGLNWRKHRVRFEEASTAFADPFSMTIDDPLHSEKEERLVLIGRSVRDRLLTVVHMELEDSIRLISARRATRRERKRYEENEKRS